MLKNVTELGNKFMGRAQGSPQITISATGYECVISTLRRGEIIVFGGTEETIDRTCVVRIAEYAGPPTIGGTATLDGDTVRIVGYRKTGDSANWELDLIKA